MAAWLAGIFILGLVLTTPGGSRRRDRCPTFDETPKDPKKVRKSRPTQHLFPQKMRRQ